MNRFTDISTSAYTPQSLEELAFVPMLKREKHDKITAQQELVRAGLAKVDPYDKHFDEAIRLKQDLESNMDKTATELSQTGINNDMIGKTIALNRQYQDLISPTGKLGQINAEKINIQKINDEYDKLGKEKGWGQDRINYWKEKALADYNSSPVYDKNGRILKYSGPEDVVNKLDANKYLNDLATNAKMSTTEFSKAISGLSKDEQSGYDVVNKSSYGYKLGDNYAAVKAAYDTLKGQVNDPTSELARSLRYEGRNIDELLNNLDVQSDVYKQSVKANDSSSEINPFGSGPKDVSNESGVPGIFGEDYNTNEIGGKESDLSQVENIGTKKVSFSSALSNSTTGLRGSGSKPMNLKGNYTSEDISDPRIKNLYDSLWNAMTTKGVVIEGKRHFINAEGRKKGKNDAMNAKLIAKAMRANPITLTSKILTTDRDLNNSGFTSSIGKTADDRDKQMRKELQMSNQGARKLIDEDGKEYTFSQAQEKFNLVGTEGVTYQGYISPLNWEKDTFKGTNSKASPHIITVKTKDGKYKEFKTSRINGDNIGININRYNDLNKNYRNYTINHDQFIPFESESPSLKDLKIKYNTQDPKIDEQRGVLNYEIMDKFGTVHYMTESEYINSVNATK